MSLFTWLNAGTKTRGQNGTNNIIDEDVAPSTSQQSVADTSSAVTRLVPQHSLVTPGPATSTGVPAASGSEASATKKIRKFNGRWLQEWPWLSWDQISMTCTTCKSACLETSNKMVTHLCKNAFVKGSKNFQR